MDALQNKKIAPQGSIPWPTRCITHIVVKQRADEGIDPYNFA